MEKKIIICLFPPLTSTYHFESETIGDGDPQITIYDQSWNEIAYSDDIDNWNLDFDMSLRLTNNTTYVIEIDPRSEMTNDQFSFTVTGTGIVKTERVSPTCETPGNIDYWTDLSTGYIYSDAACTKRISQQNTVLSALVHNLTKTEAKEPTYTAEGNTEYWTCSRCGKYFSDKNAKNEISKNSWIIPKKTKTAPTSMSIKQGSAIEMATLGKRTLTVSVLPAGGGQ